MPISNPIAFYDQAVKYTPVVPRVLELDNVAVPTAGQIYQLSAVPSDRPIIAVLQIFAGVPLSDDGWLSVVADPVGSVQSIPEGTNQGRGDARVFFNSNYYADARGYVLIPTKDGQFFCRRVGTYSNTKTTAWTLGYWEGITL